MNTGMVNYGSALAAEQTAKADKTAQAEKKGKVAVCVSEQGYEGTGTGQCFFLCKYVKDRCSHR